jgi:hypothetical protein
LHNKNFTQKNFLSNIDGAFSQNNQEQYRTQERYFDTSRNYCSANSCVTGAAHSYLFKQYCSGDRSIIAAGFIRKPAALIKKCVDVPENICK